MGEQKESRETGSYKVLRQGKLFQMFTHFLYCSVLERKHKTDSTSIRQERTVSICTPNRS